MGEREEEIASKDKYSLTREQYFELKYSDFSTSVTSFSQIEVYDLLSIMGNLLVAATLIVSIIGTTFYSNLNF